MAANDASEFSESSQAQNQRFRRYLHAVNTGRSSLVPSGMRLFGRGIFYRLHFQQPLNFPSHGYSDLEASLQDSYHSGPPSLREQQLGATHINQRGEETEVGFHLSTCAELCLGGRYDHGPDAFYLTSQLSTSDGDEDDEMESRFTDASDQNTSDHTMLKSVVESQIAVQYEDRQTPVPAGCDEGGHPSHSSSGYHTTDTCTFRSRALHDHDLPVISEESVQNMGTEPKEEEQAGVQQSDGPGNPDLDSPLVEGGSQRAVIQQLAIEVACHGSSTAEEMEHDEEQQDDRLDENSEPDPDNLGHSKGQQ